MSSIKKRIRSRVLFAWLMITGLLFFFAPSDWTGKLHLTFVGLFNRPLTFARDMPLNNLDANQPDNFVHRIRYNKLRNHLANTVEALKQERQKVKRLSGLRERPAWKGANFVLAEIITDSTDKSGSIITINRGRSDGLKKNQVVLGNYCVIGKISRVASRTAQVKLITHPDSKFQVKIVTNFDFQPDAKKTNKADIETIMRGKGSGSAGIALVPAKYRIKTGSIVYVTKIPGFLDIPTITGTVSECRRNAENPLLWDITVKPGCEVRKINKVTVVVMNWNK